MWAPEPPSSGPAAAGRPQSAAVDTTTPHHEHQLRPHPYVVGYSGYIPGLMFQYGRTFAKAAEDCVVTFLKQQEGRTTGTDAVDTAKTKRQIEQENWIRNQSERRCKSLPRMRSVRQTDANKTQKFTYATEERYPPLPGYTGHIPHLGRSTIVGRSVASATRRERERYAIQERSVERYQGQTASSRAKQVRIVKPQQQPPQAQTNISFTNTDVTDATQSLSVVGKVSHRDLDNASSIPVDAYYTSNSTVVGNDRPMDEFMTCDGKVCTVAKPKVSPVHVSQTDNVKMVLAGQIQCDDCEFNTARSTNAETNAAGNNAKSYFADSKRFATPFRSSAMQKSTRMNVGHHRDGSSAPHRTASKSASPSKRATKSAIVSPPGRGLARSKSNEPKTSTKSGKPKKTITSQTSYQKGVNPSIKTQTSVKDGNAPTDSSKVMSPTPATTKKVPSSPTKTGTTKSSAPTASVKAVNFEESSARKISADNQKQPARESTQPSGQQKTAEKEPFQPQKSTETGPKSPLPTPKFESRVTEGSSNVGKETPVI